MNISGVLVKAYPENITELANRLKSSQDCDVHFTDESGKIIITIDGESIKDMANKLGRIQKIPHVLSATMSYAIDDTDFN